MFKPIVLKLNTENIDISELKQDVTFSKYINKPKLEYGFQYFLWRTKDYMSITDNFTADKPYRIVNNFEHIIKNYKDDLLNYSSSYLNMSSKEPKILSRAFFKLWEILLYFDLALKKYKSYRYC